MIAGLMGAYTWGLIGGWLVLITIPPVIFSLFYSKKTGLLTVLGAGIMLAFISLFIHSDTLFISEMSNKQATFFWINTIITYMFLTSPLVILVGETGNMLESHIKKLRFKSDELLRSQEYLSSTIDFLPVAIGIASFEGKILKLNKRFVELFGYNTENIPTLNEWYNKAFSDDYRNEAVRQWEKSIDVAMQHNINVPPRIFRITGTGMNTLVVEVSFKMVKKQLIFAFRDITANVEYEKNLEQKKEELKLQNEAYKKLNLELEESNVQMSVINKSLKIEKKKAEQSDKFKTYFLKNISHEIRTPLNGIMGFSEMLRQKNISAEERELYADFVINSGRQFLSIIDKIVTLADLEAGNEDISKSDTDISGLMKELYNNFEQEAEFKCLSLKYDKPATGTLKNMNTDRDKIKLVLENLIENAIKFTNEGEVRFGYEIINKKNISFYVKDTGIGIPVKNQKIIFDRFMQGGPDIMKKYGGAGLGLAIISSVINLLGGSIKVSSRVGEGSTFTFLLPLEVPTGVVVN